MQTYSYAIFFFQKLFSDTKRRNHVERKYLVVWARLTIGRSDKISKYEYILSKYNISIGVIIMYINTRRYTLYITVGILLYIFFN